MSQSIRHFFLQIEDFRQPGKCSYQLADLLLTGLCTLLSNGQDYQDMVIFAQTRAPQLPDLIDLSAGIPSHDTFNRVFQLLDPDRLRSCLEQHGKAILDLLAQKQICLDGKKLRGASPRSKATDGLWIVNAWVAENRLCIGQQRVEDKSNEIDVLVPLIQRIDIEEAIVTIDAIGCQTAVAQQIIKQRGHYLLALKSNQATLWEEVHCAFKANAGRSAEEEWCYDRARFEQRRCRILVAAQVLDRGFIEQWPGLQTIVQIEATRHVGGKRQGEVRYYISDESELNPLYYSKLARGHWGIENHLHWHLDVTFNEDASRVRRGNGPENLSTLRKLALQLLTQQTDRLSLQKRRVKASFDLTYLKKIIS
eukprot:TRINITY_DN6826_c0_g1_i1.p1 TRINITY_DN6826_c0_g1~~TRINITY_DN6826_c0_g1_i1.p1  ORF type:complete len:366 (-),score=-22.89 TRINITY_DN6826_c0_g1_i1:663-1760(-)